jgi:hypothetical protein
MTLPPSERGAADAAAAARPTRIHRPDPAFGRPARRPEEVLLVCYYDPAGISTVLETVAYMQSASAYSVTVLNMFEHRMDTNWLRMHPWLQLDRFDAVIVHNTVAYNAANASHLDASLGLKMRDFGGAKILMKQDENFRMRETAQYIGDARIDLVLTCLPPEAVPLVYPPEVVGNARFERMLTGYVTPTLRARNPHSPRRPIDIGYRGSIQPLSFGRLAYEKRTIGEDVLARVKDRPGLRLDISSRWEDRLGGGAWLDFLSSCKGTLGAESGASVFDLDGTLERRIEELQARYAHLPTERERDEAVLAGIADLENNVRYHQLSPRHFEAIACGSVQLLFPGAYSGVMEPGRHFFQLERDLSNLDEALDLLRDEPRRSRIAQQAHEEVVLERRNWIEAFVERVDAHLEEILQAKGRRRHARLAGSAQPPVAFFGEAGAPAAPEGRVLRIRVDPAAAPDAGPRVGSGELLLPRQPSDAVLRAAGREGWWATPAATAGWQELLLAVHELALDAPAFCALHGVPLQQERTQAFRERLHAMVDTAAAVAAVAGGLRGLEAIVVTRAEHLPAGLLLKGGLGVPLAVVRGPLLPAGAAEGEVRHWDGVRERAAAHVDHWLPDASAETLAALAPQRPSALAWFAAPGVPYYADPASVAAAAPTPEIAVVAAVPAAVPAPAAHAPLAPAPVPLWRRAWRLLPVGLRHRVLTTIVRRQGATK